MSIDARGKSCPEPVLITKKAISDGRAKVEVLVDNNTASGNIRRFLENSGYKVAIEESNGDILVRGNK